jgi:hypothetical protein
MIRIANDLRVSGGQNHLDFSKPFLCKVVIGFGQEDSTLHLFGSRDATEQAHLMSGVPRNQILAWITHLSDTQALGDHLFISPPQGARGLVLNVGSGTVYFDGLTIFVGGSHRSCARYTPMTQAAVRCCIPEEPGRSLVLDGENTVDNGKYWTDSAARWVAELNG